MDPNVQRIAAARLRNLEYIRRLDEQGTAPSAQPAHPQPRSQPPTQGQPPRRPGALATKNTSVYITGLTTYMACKQLEGVCAQLGKVRRIKFYKDARGGLQGDALVTFASHAMMRKAVDRLNHFEIKPGVLITAAEAEFKGSKKDESVTATSASVTHQDEVPISATLSANGVTATKDQKQPLACSPPSHEPPVAVSTAPALETPSRSVILQHVWSPVAVQEEDAASFFSELEEDMRMECGKHGSVKQVEILPDGVVKICYATLESAIKCLRVMNGRWFDGRQLAACFDPETPEEPEDADTKLDAFLATLG